MAMSAPDQKSRREAIEYLKKFRDRRRNFDALSTKTDLEVLRDNHDRTSPWGFVLMVVILWRPDRFDWLFSLFVATSLLYSAVSFFHRRKLGAALALFDECTPQSVDDLLARIDAPAPDPEHDHSEEKQGLIGDRPLPLP
jgi:hypothetical protein